MTDIIKLTFTGLDAAPASSLMVLAGAEGALSENAQKLDQAAGGFLSRAVQIAKFKGRNKSAVDLLAVPGSEIDRLTILGVQGLADTPDDGWMALGGAARGKASNQIERLSIVLEPVGELETISAQSAADFALGFVLRSYEFRKYKTQKNKSSSDDDGEKDAGNKLSDVLIHCSDPEAAQAAYARLVALAEGVFLARDLVNEPPNELGPEAFAEKASRLADLGVEVELFGEQRLAELNMNALLAVGQGSARPSMMVAMRWRGEGASDTAPHVLIGKGVTFDTGGISIKPGPGMEEMKGDMAGAASVVGAMHALAVAKAPVHVVGLIGLSENMPSGTAQRPGDIVTSMSGQTIEVLNTDAEGRMVLADVVWYAQQTYEPASIVTLATLTGAIIIALGHEYAGLYSNDDELCNALIRAGQETGEKVWRMPLGKAYDKQLESKFADMKNIGSRYAGSITGAQFIKRFVSEGTKWAHLDIAGTAFSGPSTDINRSWGSGFGVRLLDHFVRNPAR
jgi:leucyl aminopeptidase